MKILGPSINDIVSYCLKSDNNYINNFLERYKGTFEHPDTPLTLNQLFNFGYDIEIGQVSDDDYYDLMDLLFEDVNTWIIKQWLINASRTHFISKSIVKAVQLSSSWWFPVLHKSELHNWEKLHDCINAASTFVDNTSSNINLHLVRNNFREELNNGKPPPPWVGHFYGAIHHLLLGLTTPSDYEHFAKCLSFSVVSPEGKRNTDEIANEVIKHLLKI